MKVRYRLVQTDRTISDDEVGHLIRQLLRVRVILAADVGTSLWLNSDPRASIRMMSS